jgi:hypothetical protein
MRADEAGTENRFPNPIEQGEYTNQDESEFASADLVDIEDSDVDVVDEEPHQQSLPKFVEEVPTLRRAAETLLGYVAVSLQLNKKEKDVLEKRLFTFSFRVRQPRKDDGTCNKTPFFNRWNTNPNISHLTIHDRRYASQEECEQVYMTLLALLLEVDGIPAPSDEAVRLLTELLSRDFSPSSLRCVYTNALISVADIKESLTYSTGRIGNYEIPTGYRQELSNGGHHVHSNVGWVKPFHINYKLRKVLRQHLIEAGASAKAVKNALDKIQVKAYCTDKVTMPPYFSNRDIRWATWPEIQDGSRSALQYASHYQCAKIELELMAELFEFSGAPRLNEEVIEEIRIARGKSVVPDSRRCFITGRLLSYQDYVAAAVNPSGGRSKYHVGHIVPLTRGGRHAFDNIAWTSDDGNRIQGNDTIEEIEAKLIDIVEYQLRRDLESNPLPPYLRERIERLRALIEEADGRFSF